MLSICSFIDEIQIGSYQWSNCNILRSPLNLVILLLNWIIYYAAQSQLMAQLSILKYPISIILQQMPNPWVMVLLLCGNLRTTLHGNIEDEYHKDISMACGRFVSVCRRICGRGWLKPKSVGLNQEPTRNKVSLFGSWFTIFWTHWLLVRYLVLIFFTSYCLNKEVQAFHPGVNQEVLAFGKKFVYLHRKFLALNREFPVPGKVPGFEIVHLLGTW